MNASAPIAVSVTSSRRLVWIQVLAHLLAAGALFLAEILPWLTWILIVAVGASLARSYRPLQVTQLVLRGDGQLAVIGDDGDASEVVLHPQTVVLPFLVVLLYRQNQRLHAITLLADSLPGEDFRVLRVWLQWRSTAAGPASS